MPAHEPLSSQDQKALEDYIKTLEDLLDRSQQLDPSTPAQQAAMDQWEQDLSESIRQNWDLVKRVLLATMDGFMETEPQETVDLLRQILARHQGAPPSLPAVNPKRAGAVEYPLDKINAQIWNLLEKDTGGQLALKAEKTGSKKPLNIYYAIDFDELGEGITITKRLTPYDKRTYIAVSALFNAGNSLVTLTQVYYAMGYTGRPGKGDLDRINASITKMTGARIYVNNEQEADAYRYDKFVYDGSLLPLERASVVARGALTDAAIHIFREPPVISFAKQRRQVTTIDVKLLQSPISKTEGNLLIDDYLIERISRAKKGRQPRRILYKTLYEKARAVTAKQRQRIPEKVRRYLDHYQQCGMISHYTMEKDGVTVYFSH